MSRTLASLCLLITLLPYLFLRVSAINPAASSYEGIYARRATPANATSIISTESQSDSDAPTSTVVESATAVSASASEQPTGCIPSSAPPVVADPSLDTMYERRLSSIIGPLTDADQVSAWLSTLGPDGKWPDSEVDYTTGCEAQRANWPAQKHWSRIVTMAAAWHGGAAGGSPSDVKNASLHEAISRAANYWFSRDFTNNKCLDNGGTDACPCDNPDNWLWNTNWFSNIILIPKLVGQTCLMLRETLDSTQRNKCIEMTGRSYQKFGHSTHGLGSLTGANAIDVSRIGMDNALLTSNVTLLKDAYFHAHSEIVVQSSPAADGIRADGAFGQHGGVLYNGNYGKDFSNGLLDMEIEAAGTQFTSTEAQRSAFGTLFDGNKWMIVFNTLTGVLHWDFSALGRFIAFPVSDNQPTRDISMNLTKVGELGQLWNSEALSNFASGYSQPSSNTNANRLLGNRMFFTNDYMVHRGLNHITTVKMWSKRTKNSECINDANPKGFHLADGVQYTYTHGDEYEDIFGAWDWNLIPGVTVDYGATELTCSNTSLKGLETFVGGVSDGTRGLAVMRYLNPVTRSLRWQKAWFFLDEDVEHVLVANITASNSSAPVYSVLDQRRLSGCIQIDHQVISQGTTRNQFRTLWHNNIGYTFEDTHSCQSDFALTVQFGERQGNWQAIGTSLEPPYSMDIYSAYVQHQDRTAALAYTVYPAVTAKQFKKKSGKARIRTLRNDGDISAVYDERNQVFMAVFWRSDVGCITFKPSSQMAHVTVSVDKPVALLYDLKTGDVSVSDPGQSASTIKVTLKFGNGGRPHVWGSERKKHQTLDFTFTLPTGGSAGDSVMQNVRRFEE